MSGLLSSLGGKFYRFGGKKAVAYKNEKHVEEESKRKSLSKEHSIAFAKKIAGILPVEAFKKLEEHHNYKNVRWGARRVARVLNYSMAILDNELHREDGALDNESYDWSCDIVTWIAFCHILPVRYQLKTDDVYGHCRPMILEAISVAETLKGACFDEMEKELIIDCAIKSHEIPAENHIILDVFHDACVLDNQMYDDVLHKELLRTELARMGTYQAWSKKVSMKNLQPSWVLYLQDEWGIDSLSNIEKSEQELYQKDVDSDTIM